MRLYGGAGERASERPNMSSPSNAVRYLQAIYAGLDHETFSVLFLDKRHRLIECAEAPSTARAYIPAKS
jgi:DNA repair protein RadC